MTNGNEGFWDRALTQLSTAWQDIAEAALVRVSRAVRPDLPDEDRERLRERIHDCIEGRGRRSAGTRPGG